MDRKEREQQILTAALDIAKTTGYTRVTREQIAAKVGITPAVITNCFGTTVALRRDIMRAAVRHKVLPVIAQGLALRDRHALNAPEDLRREAAHSLV